MKGKLKPTPTNTMKLWFHCLTSFHQKCYRKESGKMKWIACWDCNDNPNYTDDFFYTEPPDQLTNQRSEQNETTL